MSSRHPNSREFAKTKPIRLQELNDLWHRKPNAGSPMFFVNFANAP
jgi:hypothetical protein